VVDQQPWGLQGPQDGLGVGGAAEGQGAGSRGTQKQHLHPVPRNSKHILKVWERSMSGSKPDVPHQQSDETQPYQEL
jgi:hypothetical protein